MLAYCVGFAVLVVIVAHGCIPSPKSSDKSDTPAMRELREIAAVAGTLVDVYMDARVTEVLVCSKTNEQIKKALTDSDARPEANRTLSEWLKVSEGYDAIMVVDSNGVCVASAPEGLVDWDFSEDATFKRAMNGKLTLSDLHKSEALKSLDRKSKGWTLAIAAPIKGDGAPAGVLMSCLNWSRLNEVVTSVQVGKTGYVYVLNRRNQVIMHPADAFYGIGLRQRQISLPMVDEAVKKRLRNVRYRIRNVKTGRTDTKLAGLAYPKGYGNFPGQGWTIGAGADETEMAAFHPFWSWLFSR